MNEFIILVQRSMIVEEYKYKFFELLRFVLFIVLNK